MYMDLAFKMIDVDTGEIVASSHCNYALNFDRQDVGFKKILAWAQSCVRGIRTNKAKNLELRIGFLSEKTPEYLNLKVDGIEIY